MNSTSDGLGPCFATWRPPEYDPCGKVRRELLKPVLGSGGNEETSASGKGMALRAQNENARSGMDEIQLILSVWRLSVRTRGREQLNPH
jgi:hypothetical protein